MPAIAVSGSLYPATAPALWCVMLRSRCVAVLSLASLLLALFGCSAGQSFVDTDVSYRFVAMGDSRGSSQGVNTAVLSRIVTDVLRISPRPHFVVFAGDLVTDGGATELNAWKAVMRPLPDAGVAVYPVIGNHELSNPATLPQEQADFTNAFVLPTNGPAGYDELCYSISDGPVFVAALDSYYVDGAGTPYFNTITADQQAWLAASLATAKAAGQYLFAFTHDPPFPVGPHIGGSLDVNTTSRDALWKIVADSGVTAFFAGHEHLYSRRLIDTEGGGGWSSTVPQLIVGSCGAPLVSSSGASVSEAYGEKYHFAVVDVLLDGSARVKVYDSSMNLLDSSTVSH
jgi:hypothetical protein